jgi:hypothetical protein
MPALAPLLAAFGTFLVALFRKLVFAWLGYPLWLLVKRLQKWFYVFVFGGVAIGVGNYTGIIPAIFENLTDWAIWLFFETFEFMLSQTTSGLHQVGGRIPGPAQVFGAIHPMFIAWARALGLFHAMGILLFAYFVRIMIDWGRKIMAAPLSMWGT